MNGFARTGSMICALAMVVAAQDLVPKAAPQLRAMVLVGGTVHPVSGPVLDRGWVHFARGEIVAVGEGDAPELQGNPLRVDVTGKHVYPGMISAVTTIGLIEIGQVPATDDQAETGDLTPEVRAAVAVNPDSTVIPVTRSNGVLTTGVFPQGGLVPGRAAVMQMDGWTWEDMAVAADAGLTVDWPTTRSRFSRFFGRGREGGDPSKRAAEQRTEIDGLFAAARAWNAAKAADATIPTDTRLAAMHPVLTGERPVFVRANELEQIESAVAWAQRENLRMVLIGGRAARHCTDLLKKADVPVVVMGTHELPERRDDPYDEPFTLPAALEAAGVKWCLSSGGSFYNERNLPYHAATAVAFGLDRDAALRAITLGAAEILGVGDRLGSIETGKLATLIVTDGDPLEIVTKVEKAYIAGREIDLRNKQTELAEKYREKYRQLGLWPAGR